MGSGVDSDGRSADSTLLYEDEPNYDPAQWGDAHSNDRLAVVWPRSDALRKLVTDRIAPSDDDRLALKASLITQLQTLYLFWQLSLIADAQEQGTRRPKAISLYVLLFPGEAKDNTGVKDLNDKVIGQWWNSQYQQLRYQAIQSIFDLGPNDFIVAGQTYKTAFILTALKTRKDFAAGLVKLDDALRTALLSVIDQALADTAHPPSDDQKKEMKKLQKTLSNKKYRFDIYFGLRTLSPSGSSVLANVYLLVTEALKGAALSRYVAKAATLATRGAQEFAAQPSVAPDKKDLDPRGKEYDWSVYLRTIGYAEKAKEAIRKGEFGGFIYDLNSVYVDTVWTTAYLFYKNLYWGNPDVIRDVRKKKLVAPPKLSSTGFALQKDMLELWLTLLNMLDFVKSFKSDEFGKELTTYHNRALQAFEELVDPAGVIDWDNLVFVLTHDVRQTDPIAVIGTACEFQFYAKVSDYRQRIFISMDIRDMGVDLLLDYEVYNRDIVHDRLSDMDLMQETLRATDDIDARRRFTYDTTVTVMRKYYNQLRRSAAGAAEVPRAFGGTTDEKPGSFEDDVQIMLGGDEVYIAAHPQFAAVLPQLIGELSQAAYTDDQTLDLRASVAFSSARIIRDPTGQRQQNQLSHQEALKIAEDAPALLKTLERTQRRIERLIEMIEANDKKKSRAPDYYKELDALGLRRLFARAKFGAPQQMAPAAYAQLLVRLAAIEAGADPGDGKGLPDLVDFTGKVVAYKSIADSAKKLEDKVRQDVGLDNARAKAPPIPTGETLKKIKKIIDKLIPAPKGGP